MLPRLSEATKVIGLYVLSGICLGAGFFLPLPWLWGMLGVFVLLVTINCPQGLGLMVFGGYLTWTVSLAFAVGIFWSIYPIEWIDLGLGKLEWFVVGGKWLITALVLGTGGLVFGGLVWLVRRFGNRWAFIFLMSFIWLFAAVSQSWLYSVFVLGPGGTTNTYNSVGYLGYLIGSHPALLVLAKFGGVYILTVVGVLWGLFFWYLFRQLSFRSFVFSAIVGLLVLLVTSSPLVFSAGNYQGETSGVTVAIVDTTFGGHDFYQLPDEWEYRSARIREAVVAALETKADYILLPEDSRFTPLSADPEFAYKAFRFLYADPAVVLLDTSLALPLESEQESFLRAYVYDGRSKTIWLADKQYLTPLGEYMPYVYKYLLISLGLGQQVEKMNQKLSARPGPMVSQANFPDFVPGVLFCFEALNPRAVRNLLKGRAAPFIAHPISHAWFHNSDLLERHLDSMLKIQAVWNQVPIVSAGNMVTGRLYTPAGNIVSPLVVAEGERWRVSLVSL